MTHGTTLTPQPGAARSLVSVGAAEAYLAQHPNRHVIEEFRARWEGMKKHPRPEPLPDDAPKKFRRLARAAVHTIQMKQSHPLYQALAKQAEVLDWNSDPKANAYWRRLASEPKAARFALELAATALWAGDYFEVEQYRVTGALAAVLAVALGVERPQPWEETGERAHARVKVWEKKMARARRYAREAWGADS